MHTRRDFFRKASGAVALGLLPNWSLSAAESDKLGPVLPQRTLLRNGTKTTAFGLGGFHVGKTDDPAVAQALVDRAIEHGVRFFDNARTYQGGRAEEYYGQFLTPKYRDHIFLMTKSDAKDAAGARSALEASLAAMKTDHLDLWQMHALNTPGDVDSRIANGVLDEFIKAKEQGKTRYIGFTGHVNPATHLHFLQVLKDRGVELDTVQMPQNLCDPHFASFQLDVLPELKSRGYGALAMKTMAGGSMMGKLIDTTPRRIAEMGIPDVEHQTGITPADMHRYVYSLPISVLISGCETVDQLDSNVKVLVDFHGLPDSDKDRLLAATKPYAGNVVENYKRTL
ncbi:MAG TPA: aldo/keto reductase [Chthoniobacterales bacterium]|nr:aldo/keto reductase [Chthoniobacterales bacterium]